MDLPEPVEPSTWTCWRAWGGGGGGGWGGAGGGGRGGGAGGGAEIHEAFAEGVAFDDEFEELREDPRIGDRQILDNDNGTEGTRR